MIEHGPLGTSLRSSTGKHFKLVHGPEDSALEGLEGYRVLLEGRRLFNALTVRSWEVPEGVSGMAVFIGRLEQRGVQLGLTDHNSGAFYLIDRNSWAELQPFLGQQVAIEGYVDGPHRVHVLSYRALEEQTTTDQ